MSSPTQRTMKLCRERGWIPWIVEKRVPVAGKRITQDAFGFADIHVMDRRTGSLFIQACAAGDMSTRRNKILAIPDDIEDEKERKRTRARREAVVAWLHAGNRLEVWGWGQRAHRYKNGKTVKHWAVRIVPIELHDVGEPCACSFCAAVDAADEVLP